MTTPRGIRNRNPGNIIVAGWTQRQTGYTGPEPEGRFATFDTMAHGLVALIRLLQNYRQQGLSTVRGIINKWAPPVENDTSAYVLAVAKTLNVSPDQELPDEPWVYHSLARAIAGHENGRQPAADGISDRDYAEAMAEVFGVETVAVAPAPPPAVDERVEPKKEKRMPLPQAALIALGTELLSLIPWVKKNPEESARVIPKLVEVAKSVVPEARNEQEAVERVLADPIKQTNFKAEVAMKWSDIAPFLEYESKERAAARDFAVRLTTDGPTWRQIGAGALIGVLSIFIIGGGGILFWDMMYNPNLDPGQKGLILGALIAAFTTAVGFWFGSSASGRQSGQTVSDIARGKS